MSSPELQRAQRRRSSFKACHCAGINSTRVIDSRRQDDHIRRRRICGYCGGRFTTTERRGIRSEEDGRAYKAWILKALAEFMEDLTE